MTDQTSAPTKAQPIVSARLSSRGFVESWQHCASVSEYLARFAASDRFDPEQLTTRLASVINEVLEVVFRAAPVEGDISVSLARSEQRLELELEVPASEATRASLAEAFAALEQPFSAGDLVRREFHVLPDEAPPGAGLVELAAVLGTRPTLRLADDGSCHVISLYVPYE